jgi:hypothetical protein
MGTPEDHQNSKFSMSKVEKSQNIWRSLQVQTKIIEKIIETPNQLIKEEKS